MAGSVEISRGRCARQRWASPSDLSDTNDAEISSWVRFAKLVGDTVKEMDVDCVAVQIDRNSFLLGAGLCGYVAPTMATDSILCRRWIKCRQ